ncbi:hypothetical protein AAFN60_03575 [Roseibacillus persicicus]|uniref:hypothetical protein n=1 Tax=Roseibacillus persicicus TaxID=454148 RepID=UPI00398BA91A
MKNLDKTLLVGALLGTVASAHAAPFLVPNGDFSTPDGADWTQASSEGTIISYQLSGGNSDGYAEIDNTSGSWGGVLVSEGGSGPNPAVGDGIPLSELGLTAGETYTFSLDMINLGAGANQAGMKMESWAGGFLDNGAGDVVFPLTNSWETYSLEYTINPAATHLKFVPLLVNFSGPVGFDNVGGDNTALMPPPFEPLELENGDFEIPDGVGWGTGQGTPVYNATGGNPSGHVVLDGTAEFAVLYGFNNMEVSFEALGLAPGDTFLLQMDIKLISGNFGAGYRLEGPSGYVIDETFEVIGNGSEWATYSVELTVPASPGQTKIGLRPGGSVVAFDNVSIVNPEEIPFSAEVVKGAIVNWVPTSATNNYQPQKSADGVTFTNLGPAIEGNSISSVYDAEPALFYQVVEASIEDSDDVLNGGFESVDEFDSFCAQAWTCLAGVINDQFATRLATDNTVAGTIATPDQVRTGVAALQLKVVNAETEALPGKSLTQQNVLNSGGSITPGNTYTFSFWAKQVSSGPSYVQGYKLAWLEESGGVISVGAEGGFAGGDGEWAETAVAGLVAPANATSALIEIFGATGAVDGGFGEVLLDDISLITEGSSPIGTLPATTSTGMGVTYPTLEGFSYQVQASSDLISFSDLGEAVIGDGNPATIGEPSEERKFFQVVKTVTP